MEGDAPTGFDDDEDWTVSTMRSEAMGKGCAGPGAGQKKADKIARLDNQLKESMSAPVIMESRADLPSGFAEKPKEREDLRESSGGSLFEHKRTSFAAHDSFNYGEMDVNQFAGHASIAQNVLEEKERVSNHCAHQSIDDASPLSFPASSLIELLCGCVRLRSWHGGN